jgi:bacterioferritin-associated ferredoxin
MARNRATHAPPRPEAARVYVCICNALTSRHVKHAIDQAAAARPAEIYAACGCRAQCGSCVKKLLGLLREAEPVPQGAD